MPLQLRSLVRPEATLELSLADVPMSQLQGDDEVLVQMEAAPLNPSDQGLLFGGADLSTARVTGSAERPIVTARIPDAAMAAQTKRVGQSMVVGNEGAGTVVAAGPAAAAQALLGRRVALLGGGMYSQYRAITAAQCLALPQGATAAQGASSFVNPLTALGMVETMRREGHQALVHTAAASNLGQMLNRICLRDGVPLVNVVRKPEQAQLLRAQGATQVVDSSQADFVPALNHAVELTGATLAFDAIGGGPLAGQILQAMEAALQQRDQGGYNRYGTSTHKQVYVYGSLDRRPIEVARGLGMHWGVGGWLLFPFLQKVGPERVGELKQRVADELTSTFASHYTREVTLAQALSLDAIGLYGRQATGEKVLLRLAAG
jgi:NADPH2:quinone reductase